MNPIDILLFIPILFFALIGAWRGFLREAFSMLGWLVGGSLGFAYYPATAQWIPENLVSKGVGNILAFVVILMAMLILAHFLAHIADKVFSWIGLGFFNQLLGLVFGAFKGLIIISLLVYLWLISPWKNNLDLKSTILGPTIEAIIDFSKHYFPPNSQDSKAGSKLQSLLKD
ncbi:MAG: CvpA family protein [Gammaproteobacteria bacterium]|nr:CvpA family protein [Gammaproteobacteria bacterium]